MDFRSFVKNYITSSKNIKFTNHLSDEKIENYEKQYDICDDREFYFVYNSKYSNTYLNDLDEDSDYEYYYSQDEYNSGSSSNESSDDEIEYY